MRLCYLMAVHKSDSPDLFKSALESITFHQTVKPDQVVLVKDGPLGIKLERIISNINFDSLHVVSTKKSGGLAKALNFGLNYVDCDWIARMDSDDFSLPNRTETILQKISRYDLDFFGFQIIEKYSNGTDLKRETPLSSEKICQYFYFSNPFNHVTMVMKKDFIVDVDPPVYPIVDRFEDYALWGKLISLSSQRNYRNFQEVTVLVTADEGYIERRNGISYALKEYQFRKYIYNLNYFNPAILFIAGMLRIIMHLMPFKSFKKRLYKINRRKNHGNK